MTESLATLAAPGEALLGEAPRWMSFDGAAPTLHFSDLLSGTIYSLDGDRAPLRAEFAGETVSAIIPLVSGQTAVALHRALVVLNTDGTTDRRIELDLPVGARLSDASAGPSGHVWLGVVPAGDEPVSGMLMRLGPDGASIERSEVGFSNGLGFTADGTALLHIDSTSNTVWRIAHDPVTGALGEALELFRLPAEQGALDGLCLDEYDRAWVAVFGGGEVLRIGRDGSLEARVLVPALRVTSCAFGADTTLFITTARIDAPGEELAEYPLAGSLFRIETDCHGGPVWKGQL